MSTALCVIPRLDLPERAADVAREAIEIARDLDERVSQFEALVF